MLTLKLYLLLPEDLPNKCRKFRASERVLDELELELLIAPESTGEPVAATVPPPVPPPPSEEVEVEVEEEESLSFLAQPAKNKLIIPISATICTIFFMLPLRKSCLFFRVLKRICSSNTSSTLEIMAISVFLNNQNASKKSKLIG